MTGQKSRTEKEREGSKQRNEGVERAA